MILHAQVATIPRKENTVEALGEEVSHIHSCGNVTDSNLQFLDVVAYLEVANIQVACAL